MRYRRYGRNGPKVSVLGFGAMRLPGIAWDPDARPDYARAKALIRRALRAGVNFIDSHHNYHGGHSEIAIGKALAGWTGQRVYLQTKTPFYRPEPLDYFKRLLERALEKLGAGCIDYLLFHSMRMDMFRKRGKGLAVSVMNPVGGGSLAADTPEVLRMLPGAKTGPEVALRYVLDTPGVCVALSGMSTPAQMDENVRTAGRKSYLTPLQRKALRGHMRQTKRKFMAVCTSCGYCMPCPHGVNIPQNFLLWNQARYLGLKRWARARFKRLRQRRDGDASALACRRCGQCLPKCPNDIPIIEQLAASAKLLK